MKRKQSSNAEERSMARKEAARWIARLRRPDRDGAMEGKLRQWLSQNPANTEQFDAATQIWENLGGIDGSFDPPRPKWKRRFVVTGSVFAVAASALFALMPQPADRHFEYYATGPRQLSTVTLADGSRIQLAAESRVAVSYDARNRYLRLEEGEAFFDVAPDHQRPFVVNSLTRNITALGTAFGVDRRQGMEVTLVHGKVAIAPDTGAKRATVILLPRQQWHMDGNRVVALSPVEVERAVAWKDHELVLDDTRLAEAVAEVNRYAPKPIRLADGLGSIRISGVFDLGEADAFARTVAAMHDLSYRATGTDIRLTQASGGNLFARDTRPVR